MDLEALSDEELIEELDKHSNDGADVELAAITRKAINDLPDSDFAYIEPGGKKDKDGKTVPRGLRHLPIHDEAHVRNALQRLPQTSLSPAEKAKARKKIVAAAKKFGITVSKGETNMSTDKDKASSLLAQLVAKYSDKAECEGVINKLSEAFDGDVVLPEKSIAAFESILDSMVATKEEVTSTKTEIEKLSASLAETTETLAKQKDVIAQLSAERAELAESRRNAEVARLLDLLGPKFDPKVMKRLTAYFGQVSLSEAKVTVPQLDDNDVVLLSEDGTPQTKEITALQLVVDILNQIDTLSTVAPEVQKTGHGEAAQSDVAEALLQVKSFTSNLRDQQIPEDEIAKRSAAYAKKLGVAQLAN